MALQKQVITIPLSEGIDTKTDEFQVSAGKALVLENARFYKLGKIQKRFGFVAMSTDSTNGDLSTLNKNAVVADDNSINLLTDEGVFSYSEGLDQWQKISGISDIVKLKSEFLSKSAYTQFNPDMDMDETSGLAVTVFKEVEENATNPSPANYLTVVLEDKETGTKKVKRFANTGASGEGKQKVMITNDNGTVYIHVFFVDSSGQMVGRLLDANLAELASLVVYDSLSTNATKYKMDVCKDANNYFHFGMYETSLKIRKFSNSGTLLSTATFTTTNRLGSVPVGGQGLGFSVTQDSAHLHLFYVSNTTTSTYPTKIVGIGFNKSLANTITETSKSGTFIDYHRDIAITVNGSTIIAAVDAVSGSKCVVCKWIATFTTSYSITEVDPIMAASRVTLQSRPFVMNGVNYVVLKCPETDQPTGFVFNLDTKTFSASFSPYGLSRDRRTAANNYWTGTCNSVASGDAIFTALEKLYGSDTNSANEFGNLSYEFNANSAITKLVLDYSRGIDSGTKVKIGETNYYTNGTTFALDSRGGLESGFWLRPLIDTITLNNSGGANPNVASKTFSYIAVYNFYNGKGELERSLPSPSVTKTTASDTSYLQVVVKNFMNSYKNSFDTLANYTVEIVLYRTQASGSVFNRVLSSPVGNFVDTVTLYDAASDASILNNEILYTSGSVLGNDATPNAKFSTAGGNRMFLGGLEEEDEIAYSKKQLFGEAVAFSDFFRIRISSGTSSDKSRMSALGYMDGKLIIFRENSIYYIAGDGPLETGAQDTFTEPEVISSDTGCLEPRSVVNIPSGLLFKSKKGIYVLDRAMQVNYIGSAVEEFNGEGIVSAIVSDKFNEARFYTEAGNCLAYNYLFNSWSVFKDQTTIDADIWDGSPVQIMGDGVSQESESVFVDNGTVYTMKIKTPWLKLSGLQDFGRVWSMTVLGRFKSAHDLIVKARYDYDDSYVETYTISPLVTDAQYQYRVSLKKQLCESVQFEIYDSNQVGESMDLSALTIEAGFRTGSMKLGATRKY